jgi:hypothetical protein
MMRREREFSEYFQVAAPRANILVDQSELRESRLHSSRLTFDGQYIPRKKKVAEPRPKEEQRVDMRFKYRNSIASLYGSSGERPPRLAREKSALKNKSRIKGLLEHRYAS